MPDPARLRDSTQIVLPRAALEELRSDLTARYTVTIDDAEDPARIVASPVVIKEVTDFLARRGVPVA